MATHIRMLLQVGPHKYMGSQVFKYLSGYHQLKGTVIPKEILAAPKWKQVEWLAARMTRTPRLKIFREPARTKPEHSAYLKTLVEFMPGIELRPRPRRAPRQTRPRINFWAVPEVAATPDWTRMIRTEEAFLRQLGIGR